MPLPAIRMPSRARLLAALSALLLFGALVGCSTLSGSDAPPAPAAPAPSGAAAGSAPELTELQVGVLPIVDLAAVQRAQSAGYFAAEGLTVELVTIQGGAAAVPQLVSGDLDLTWSSWPSVILAQQQGVTRFHVLQTGYDTADGSFQLMTLPGSTVRTPQDLVGKKVATNTFRSITEIMARSAMQRAGVDPNGVQFVELPFPDMIPALQNNQIDAAILLEPFVTVAKGMGAVSVLNVASGPTAGLPIAGVASTAEFAQQNPNTVAAFSRALDKAQAEMSDRAIVEQVLPTYTTIKPDAVSQLQLGAWPATLEAERLQQVADLMLEFGVITEKFDVAPLLAD